MLNVVVWNQTHNISKLCLYKLFQKTVAYDTLSIHLMKQV